jgi:hypothetical protein
MKKSIPFITAVLMIFCSWTVLAATNTLTDSEIKKQINECIRQYNKPCPCPYSTDKAGNLCGDRSAYIRTGGKEPCCYAKDIITAGKESCCYAKDLPSKSPQQ